MEQNFYRDEFEQMLKDTTDDFRMYPSRKVWHSIYNDLHPDRKWPSFAVTILLLSAILYIGVSNNNSISKRSKNQIVQSINNINQKTIGSINNNASIDEDHIKRNYSNESTIHSGSAMSSNLNIQVPNISTKDEVHSTTAISPLITSPSENSFAKNENVSTQKEINPTGEISMNFEETSTTKSIQQNSTSQNSIKQNPASILADMNNQNRNDKDEEVKEDAKSKMDEINLSDKNSISSSSKTNSSVQAQATATSKSSVSIVDKAWMENDVFYNKRNRNKWKSNLSIGYFITPSIGYRELFKNNEFGPSSGLLLRTINNNNTISQQAALNLEAGAILFFGISKKLRLTTGFQFNYTNYITYAHALQHPAQTTVLMNNLHNGNLMPVTYNSNYGNVLGSNLNSLSNRTTQISMPLGADFKLAGKNKIKWYVGANLQPTYIISGKAYLISSDYKNYVEDASLLRGWNLNSSVETFVSFKTPGNFNINVGPQLRYQLLSTYTKQYSYTEKLYNVGMKIGISKKL